MNIIDFTLLLALFISTIWRVELIKTSKTSNTFTSVLSRDDSTALKGLSAFFVIAAHTHAWLRPQIIVAPADKIANIILTQLGGMGVIVFFFLSGYGIQEGYGCKKVNKNYLVKRAKNVLVPYVILKLLFLIVDLLLGIAESKDILNRLVGIVTLEDWFIMVIVIEYIFYYMARKIEKHFFVLMLLFNVALTILFIIQGREDRYINSMWLFLFGIMVSMYQSMLLKMISRRYYLIMPLSLVAFVGLGAVFAINKGAIWADVVKPASGMALCLFLVCVLQKAHLKSDILLWGGKKSLHLYIVHVWAISVLSVLLTNESISFVVLIVVTIIIVQMYFWIENWITSKCQ